MRLPTGLASKGSKMIDWIRRDARTKHLYRWDECSSFMFVMNMHFEIESKRYVYSLLKFLFIIIAIWLLIPIFIWSSYIDLRSWRGVLNIYDGQHYSYEDRRHIERQARYHRANISHSLWLVILAPLLMAWFAFTHIKKEN